MGKSGKAGIQDRPDEPVVELPAQLEPGNEFSHETSLQGEVENFINRLACRGITGMMPYLVHLDVGCRSEDGDSMGKVICDISISADGYAAGPGQTQEKPFGDGPTDLLHAWMFETPDENKTEVDQITAAGATVMGRNMFGPVRGEWDVEWRGWWGENPPYHNPVFVLTHYPHDSLTMEGGTTFNFVTDGIHSALDQARAAAGEQDVAIAGGAGTVNQYLAAGLIDELRTHISPVILGAGERLFDGVSAQKLEVVSARVASLVTHITYRPSS